MIAQISQRAYQYGITAEGYGDANAVTVGGHALSSDEVRQRKELIDQIRQKGYDQVMEEVAYTWFNRFIALRFMEVNNYLPSHIRVFSDSTGAFKPEILSNALYLDLSGLDREKVAAYIETNQTEALYRYLLLTQCNALNEALPRMFEEMGGYTELLFPNNILRPDSVLGRMVTDIPEEDWTDQVQIIGWLYQYYISEVHEAVVDPIHGKQVKREDIPAATQLFTTDWVVRYMVDNSLGRYWIERHPESKLHQKLEYLVLPKDGKFPEIEESVSPQELTFLDPCAGSGHILVYAFDVLMEIYKESGYSERDAAAEIVRNNLFGLDLDPRCTQLAYFALMMKARNYDRRFLSRGIEPQIYHPMADSELLEYGSMTQVHTLPEMPKQPEELTLYEQDYDTKLDDWNYRRLLSQRYAVVCTNPPYLNKYNPKIKAFVTENYKGYSSDLFSVFIYRDLLLCKQGGYCGYMTPNVWMFLKSYEKLRDFLFQSKYITSLIQMAKGAFFKEATVDICTFVIKNEPASDRVGLYLRLEDFKGDMDVQNQKVLEAIANPECDYFYEVQQSNFSKIPGSPVAYWAPRNLISLFSEKKRIGDLADVRIGMGTGNNDLFLREWWEVCKTKIGFGMSGTDEADASRKKYFPYGKGGDCRRWYGNQDKIVWYDVTGRDMMKRTSGHRENGGADRYFQRSLTWSYNTSGAFNARYMPQGFVFDVNGSSIFPERQNYAYVLAFLLSTVCRYILSITNATITTQAGNIRDLPIVIEDQKVVNEIAEECIALEKKDWDSFETSWDFKKNPLA